MKKQNTLQKVLYLPQINESPTSMSVVHETMKRAQKTAKKCSRKTISVTCNLAIAKSSMSLQANESPTYDNLFIYMGIFHIKLPFFFGFKEIYGEIRRGARLTRSWCNMKIFIKIFHFR